MNEEVMQFIGKALINDVNEIEYLRKEIDQLTNNWNELEEYLKGLIDNFKEDVSTPILHEQLTIEMIYEYMQEIKGGDDNNV